jgi:IPT/TIG domain
MKAMRALSLIVLAVSCLASLVHAQTPVITIVRVKDTGCVYHVSASKNQCSIGAGMTLVITGSNFGKIAATISMCDCPGATVLKWTPTQITALVNSVTASSAVSVETVGGARSNGVPYAALGPLITSIVVGNCTYTPNQSSILCLISPGTQFTVNGSYFGPQTIYSLVSTCEGCSVATIDSWNPTWATSPSPYNNQVTATATQTACGYTVAIVGDMWSNFIPYTAC